MRSYGGNTAVNMGKTNERGMKTVKRSRRFEISLGRRWRARRGQGSNGAVELGEKSSPTEVGEDAHGVDLGRHPLDFL
jgi:hypothetical protein